MGHTLVLSSSHLPISFIPVSSVGWQDAIKSVYLKTSIVVQEYDDWEVRSPSYRCCVPSIIVSRAKLRYRNTVAMTRENIFLRDKYTCQYCGEVGKNLTYDHVIPRAFGGKTNWENITSACHRCNIRRGTNVKIQPANKPYKPTYHHLVEIRKTFPIVIPHASWNDYLGYDESLVTIARPQNVPGFFDPADIIMHKKLYPLFG
jgi:5-methylcytosine-specific restriction endonuclease McrA